MPRTRSKIPSKALLLRFESALVLGNLFRRLGFCRDFLLQHRPEKAVGVRQIREHHQIVSEACSDPVRKVNPLLGQHIRSAKRFELGMAAQKISDNGLVFFFKKRARGIDKAESQKVFIFINTFRSCFSKRNCFLSKERAIHQQT